VACKAWASISLDLQKVLNTLHFPFNVHTTTFCDSCKLGKMHKLPFQRADITVKAPLELVYSDVWGPAPMLSREGYRYYIAFVDAFTHGLLGFFLSKLKSDAFNVFVKFKKVLSCNLIGKSSVFKLTWVVNISLLCSYLTEMGVHVRFSCPYTHQQNGQFPERKHRNIVEMG
jgi:hypothetical protein